MGGLPINPVLTGLLQGIQTGLQIRQQQMARDAFELRRQEFERERMLDDLRTQSTLQQNARPVRGGTVEDIGTGKIDYNAIPGSSRMTDLMGGLYGGREYEVPVIRKADPRRTVKYKTAAGDQQEYELLTPEEQQARNIRFSKQEAQAKAEMERQAEEGMLPIRARRAAGEARGRAKGEAEAIRETGMEVDLSEAFPGLAIGKIIVPAKGGSQALSSIARLQGVLSQGQSRENVAGRRAESNEKVATIKAGARKGAGGGIDKFTRQQIVNVEKDLRNLQTKEQDLHAQREEINDKIAAKAYDAELMKSANAKLKALGIKIRSLQKQQRDAIRRKGELYGKSPQEIEAEVNAVAAEQAPIGAAVESQVEKPGATLKGAPKGTEGAKKYLRSKWGAGY